MKEQNFSNGPYLPVYFRANTAHRQIAITVDDCSHTGNLRRILRIFGQYDAGLTLFPIGYTLADPDVADLIRDCVVKKGYEIENHTMNHARIFRLPEDEMAREIWEQGQELNRVLGVCYRQHFFRLMGGDGIADLRIHSYLKQLGFQGIAQWSFTGSHIDDPEEEIREHLYRGAILLFHTNEKDAEKLERFIPFALSRGYHLVTLNELLGFGANEMTAYRPETMPEPEAYEEDWRTCAKGDYAWKICRMQTRLMDMNLLVIDGGKPTGYYGELTRDAVKRFQEMQGLPATGVADAETQQALLL